MIRTLLPAGLGLIAILGLSAYEGVFVKDRWGAAGIESAELGKRFDQVPKDFGEWQGEDLPVAEVVRNTAGAVSYVSRNYTNIETGQKVRLWLIVGHSRDITRHTPNICYPSSGFHQKGSIDRQHVSVAGGKEAVFYTAKFQKENEINRSVERVFWTFNHPEENQWEAPQEGARWRYGLAKSLYKLYFVSGVEHNEDTIEESVAVEFAEAMLPLINAALFPTEPAEAEAETEAESSESP